MGQVGHPSPEGQVVPSLLPGNWIVTSSVGVGESWFGQVWVCVKGIS